jgi:hypothetical protein
VLRAREALARSERERVFALRDYWLARTELDLVASGVTGFTVREERPRLERLELSQPGGETEKAEGHD